jgi:flagellar motor switch protein FliG
MITRIFLLLLMGLWLQSGSLRAQNSISNLDVALTEQRFDAIANEALARFFDPGTYRVSVRLVLDGALVTQSLRADSASGTAATADRLPALPFYQRGVESEIRRPQTPATIEPKTQTQSQVTIRSMSVSLWLSDRLDAGQAEFARRVVTEALKIDAERGDRLSVQRESMPVRQTAEASSPSAPFSAKTDSVSTTTTVNAGTDSDRLLWIVLLGLVLVVAAYFIWRNRIKKASVTATEAVVDETDFAIPALPAAPMMPQASAASASNAPLAGDPQFNVGRVTLSHLDNRIDAMEFLLHVFMIHAEEISRLMESWITTDSIAGTERVVNVLLLVDPKFLNAFKPYMSAGVYKQIERTMAVKAEMGVNKNAIDVLETMAQDVKKRFRVENGTVRLIALQQFDFVNHIEDSVLRRLLEAQSAETCALVLYHLDSQRASAILSTLPRELVEETLLLIPLVRGMEFAVYDRIAKQVFDAYHEWMRSQSLVVKGLMQTVFILESLAEELRVPYLETMSVVDPLWSAKIRTNLITEETLDSVSDELLRPAVLNVNIDRLSILASVVSEELSERMISIRTPREQSRLRQILTDAGSIQESVRRRELNDFLTLLREERTRHLDTVSAA